MAGQHEGVQEGFVQVLDGNIIVATFMAGLIFSKSDRTFSSLDLLLAAIAHLMFDFPCIAPRNLRLCCAKPR